MATSKACILAVTALLLCLCACLLVVGGAAGTLAADNPAPAVRWNGEASLAGLMPDALSKILPAWKTSQMVWPTDKEIEACRAQANDNVKAEAVNWIGKFIKAEYLPDGLSDHLVAMKQWGVAIEIEEEKRRSDVFIVRYVYKDMLLHIQESPANVVITVSGVPAPVAQAADQRQFVLETGTKLFKEGLMFDPSVRDVLPRTSETGITQMSWYPPSTISRGKDGRSSYSVLKGGQLGVMSIGVDTDGRFIRFSLLKADGGPSQLNPFRKRF